MSPFTARTIACHECDLLQHEINISSAGEARCFRCGAILYGSSPDSIDNSLALALAAAVLFVLANIYPLLGMEIEGNQNATTIYGTVIYLWDHQMRLVSVLVCITIILIPAIEICMIIYILLPMKFQKIPSGTSLLLRILQSVKPWSMVEILMLGILVSLVKLKATSTIIPGVALWSFGGLTLMLAALSSSFNPRDIWTKLGRDFDGETTQ